MLGSVGLHAAILLLPVSGTVGVRNAWTPGAPIHARLRALPSEPSLAESPAEFPRPAAPPAERAPPEPQGTPQPEARSGSRESPEAVTIPGSYVDAKQLTESPRPLTEPRFDMLQSILARPGIARLTLYIDQSGRVADVEVISSTLPPKATERAVTIFSAMRFSPGRIGNLAVRSRVPVTVGAAERSAGD